MTQPHEIASSRNNRSIDRIGLRLPAIVMVLAATAVPIEWLPHGRNPVDVFIKLGDSASNVIGYVPIGIVLGEFGLLRALIAAALMATLAETLQFVMLFRDPSVADVCANIIGATLGAIVSLLWKIRAPAVTLNRGRALTAAALAAILVVGVRVTAGDAISTHGATTSGQLEAHWAFDEDAGRTATDSSGNGLHGRFIGDPQHVVGVLGKAVRLTTTKDYIDAGRSTTFRLIGSMTVSAWINSASYPRDDAAIVSNFKYDLERDQYFGFQFDTNIDRGPRTIGFKLADSCGKFMARYGATPLRLDTWYHVAGVYNAESQAIDVYVNGELDNGALVGSTANGRRSTREPLYIGRRSDLDGYSFTGVLDDVHLYSLPLVKTEIADVMRGATPDHQPYRTSNQAVLNSEGEHIERGSPACSWSSEVEDSRIPAVVALFGVLIGLACIGFWPSAPSWQWLVVCLFAGRLLLPFASGTLPSWNKWAFPLTSLAGGASVVMSRRRPDAPLRSGAE